MSDPKDQKICVMYGVRELGENDPVELWRDGKSGRLCIVALNEGRHSSTFVDLLDVIDWLGTEHASNILAMERRRRTVTPLLALPDLTDEERRQIDDYVEGRTSNLFLRVSVTSGL